MVHAILSSAGFWHWPISLRLEKGVKCLAGCCALERCGAAVSYALDKWPWHCDE